MSLQISYVKIHGIVLAVGDIDEMRIKICAQIINPLGQGIAEIFVLPAPKILAFHHDSGSETLV